MNKQLVNDKPSQPFDPLVVRQDFPILQQTVNDHPLVYLDNAATTQKPQAVLDTLNHYYQHDNANVHRGIHALSERATRNYEAARGTVQYFINAPSAKECVFTRGTTESINLVANSFVTPRLQPGEEILLSEMEHHSNIVPWQMVCKKTGANLRVVPFNEQGVLDAEAFTRMINPKTKFIALCHASNALGTINPIKQLIKIAHEHDVLVLIDGAQAISHMRVDVQDLDCDFYVFSGHKLYAPTGIGILWARSELLDSMAPYQGGGEMIRQVSFTITEYQEPPHKFEAGTPNIAGAIGLAAALDYLQKIGLDNIFAYEHQLAAYAETAITQVPNLLKIGNAEQKICLCNFLLGKIHAHDVGTILNNLGIAIRSGHHCAMPVIQHFNVPATIRASLAFYNTKEEIDLLVSALQQANEVLN